MVAATAAPAPASGGGDARLPPTGALARVWGWGEWGVGRGLSALARARQSTAVQRVAALLPSRGAVEAGVWAVARNERMQACARAPRGRGRERGAMSARA